MSDTPIRPSRDFLVRQATLTALVRQYPASVAVRGLHATGARMTGLIFNRFQEGEEFCAAVRREYRALAATYRVAA